MTKNKKIKILMETLHAIAGVGLIIGMVMKFNHNEKGNLIFWTSFLVSTLLVLIDFSIKNKKIKILEEENKKLKEENSLLNLSRKELKKESDEEN